MATVSDTIAATFTLKAQQGIAALKDVSRQSKVAGQSIVDAGNRAQSAGVKINDGAARGSRGLKDLRGNISKASANIGTLGLAAAAIGTATAGFFSVANAASRLNEQISGAKVTFGAAAGSVREFSKTTADGLGLAASASLKAANQFGAFFKQAGFANASSAKMSVTLVQLAGDLASFKDVSADQSLGAIASGLAGESEPLRRLGVDLRIAKVDAEALASGFATTAKEITETDRVAARYVSLLRQTRDAQGDAARTANEFANAQRRFQASTEDFKAGAGQFIVSGLSDAMNGINAIFKSIETRSLKPIRDNNSPVKTEADRLAAAAKVYDAAIGKFGEGSPQAASAMAALRVEVDAAEKSALRTGQAFESTARATARVREEAMSAVGSLDSFRGAMRGAEDASIRVADANRVLGDAERKLNELRAAGAVNADRIIDAEKSVASASKTVAQARKGVLAAEKELQRFRDGTEAKGAERDIAKAELALDRAKQQLKEARSSRSGSRGIDNTLDDRINAGLGVRGAEQSLADAEDDLRAARQAQGDLPQRAAAAEQAVAEAHDQVRGAIATQVGAEQDLRIARAGDPEFARNLAGAEDDVARARREVIRASEDLPAANLKARIAGEELTAKMSEQTGVADTLAQYAKELGIQYDYAAVAAGRAAAAIAAVPAAPPMWAEENSRPPLGPPGGGGGGGGGISVGGIARGVGSFLTGGGIFGRAAGGPMSAGTPYMVGEKGPELVVPYLSGRVKSNSETNRQSGTAATQNVSISLVSPHDAGVVAQAEYAGRLVSWQLSATGRR